MANPDLVWMDQTAADPMIAGRSIVLTQGKLLGGSSSANGMMYVRGQRSDYDGWAAAGCDGWSWDQLLPYYKRFECFEEGDPQYYGHRGELRISWMRDVHATSEAFLSAARQAGLPFNPDMRTEATRRV